MKLKSNNLRFFKIKWFFSLYLGVIIFLFVLLPVRAMDIGVCVPKDDNCFAYTGVDAACIHTNGCNNVFRSITIGDSYPTAYKFCASIKDPNKCYTYSTSDCPKASCQIITFTLPGVTGSADPIVDKKDPGTGTTGKADSVITKGKADPVGYSQKLTNPLGEGTTIHSLIGKAVNSLMGIVGALALLMFVYGGLTWMTSSGSQDKVKKGKDIMVWAAVGLIVIFSAYGLVKFIINILTK